MTTFKLIISAIDAPLYNGDASSVNIPGEEGQMTVLAHHEALITRLKEGVITVHDTHGEHTYPVTSGVVEISNNAVTVLL
jgi:F-type H+-transporting ATPase subunit epsilon